MGPGRSRQHDGIFLLVCKSAHTHQNDDEWGDFSVVSSKFQPHLYFSSLWGTPPD